MFDARFAAFASVSALLVISPGASMAVVLRTAVEEGRRIALATVVGVNLGNSTLAVCSAVGMAVVLARWPWALQVVRGAGALYLAWLGVAGLWRAWRPVFRTTRMQTPGADVGGPGDDAAPRLATGRDGPQAGGPGGCRLSTPAAIGRGVMTNVLNPPVILFYMAMLPQFIGPRDPFLARFLLLAATHVSMSLAWLSMYAVTVGTLAERMTRPAVRRAFETITGAILLMFAGRLVWR